ncbi:cell cycle control protein cwf16 [Diaporthe helianthi]|uniref:Splicing factor YJU2 n=1 Tax=Diaporthe helianthi TaxID=158607 RepID=A0A2P5I8Y5_DIAHE|nr:cell cycle control protein cwf16 [Diaporthe helianthi]
MSERKVLSKYYPPDFDPSQLTKKKGPKQVGPKVQTVRLMAPFSMKCTSCGEYIYKGRKFNARKETPEDEKYLGIQIFRFYIRCTRCSSEITFKTDPKNQDYTCERGAKRNTEPWRKVGDEDETDEQRLDRLEKEDEERNAMEELEAKTIDAKRDMAVADALDEIRTRNARMERANHDGMLGDANLARPDDDVRRLEEEEDEEAYRKAIAAAKAQQETWEVVEEEVSPTASNSVSSSHGNGNGNGNGVKRKAPEDDTAGSFSFKKQAKKKEPVLIPGLKMGPPPAPAAKPAPAPAAAAPAAAKAKAVLVDYGSDSD